MDLFRADLHVHSFFSDGKLSPQDLLILAKQNKLNGLSITDHDTMGAYDEAFFSQALDLSLIIVPGMEVSTEWMNESIHVLAYGLDIKNPDVISFIEDLKKRRQERNAQILDKLLLKRVRIPREKILLTSNGHTKGRMHIASLMKELGYVKSIKEAMDNYIKDGQCCYAKGNKISTEDALEKIHALKGKAVLAHPQLIREDAVVDSLITLPFDGIEVFYGTMSYSRKKWLDIAQQKKWIMTGGSDYHSSEKSILGSSTVELGSVEALCV
jgi:predicted metal-dependent phosphoesterase TrpH